MKSVIVLLSFVCLIMSCNCPSNHNPEYVPDSPDYRMLMKRLEEFYEKQKPKNVYYFKQSPIIEALIRADTSDRSLREKLKAAYEKSEKMEKSELDSLINELDSVSK